MGCWLWLLLPYSLLFILSGLLNLVSDTPAIGVVGSLGSMGIGTIGLWVFFWTRRTIKSIEDFLVWIAENRQELLANKTCRYEHRIVSQGSVVVQFRLAFSLLPLAYRIPSAFYFPAYDDVERLKWLYSGLSLLLGLAYPIVGWWYIIRCVWHNFKGSGNTNVYALCQSVAEADA